MTDCPFVPGKWCATTFAPFVRFGGDFAIAAAPPATCEMSRAARKNI